MQKLEILELKKEVKLTPDNLQYSYLSGFFMFENHTGKIKIEFKNRFHRISHLKKFFINVISNGKITNSDGVFYRIILQNTEIKFMFDFEDESISQVFEKSFTDGQKINMYNMIPHKNRCLI